MTALRLSPAMRNMLRNAIIGKRIGQGLAGGPLKIAATCRALEARGLIDAELQPTEAGRAVFTPKQPGGRTLNLVHCTGHVHAILPDIGNGSGDRRFFAVKIDGKGYEDLQSTTQQAAMHRAFMRAPMARSVVVRSPR